MDNINVAVKQVPNGPSPKKRIVKVIVISVIVLVALIFGLYLFATSSFFLKSVVLPIAEDHLKLPVKAESINVSLFSSTVEVKTLMVGKVENPVLKCGRAFIHCDFFSLPSKIIVNKIDLEDTGVNLLQTKDGKWNLPLFNKEKTVEAKSTGATSSEVKVSSSPKTPSKAFELPKEIKLPVYLEVHDLKVGNLSISVRSDVPANPYHFSVSNFNFQLKNLVPSGKPEISYSANLKLKNKNMEINEAKLNFSGSGKLTEGLMPENLLVKKTLTIVDGSVWNKDLSGNILETAVDLSFDGNKFNIRQISLDDSRRGEISDKVTVSAKGSINPLQADLSINAPAIPEILIGMTGVAIGRVGTTVKATLACKENRLHTTTDITAYHKPLEGQSGAVPGFNLKFNDELSVDLNDKSLAVSKLDADVSEELGGSVKLTLSEPFTYHWAASSSAAAKSSSIKLLMKNIHLKTFAPFIKSPKLKLNNGSVSGAVNTVFDQKNKQINVHSKFTGKDIAMKVSGNDVSGLSFLKSAVVTVKDMKSVKVEPCKLEFFQNGKTLCAVNTKVEFDLKSQKLDYQVIAGQVTQDSLDIYPPLAAKTTVAGKALEQLGAFKLDAAVVGNMLLAEKQLTVNKFGIKFNRGTKGILSAVTSAPFTVNLAGTGELISQSIKTQVQSKEFDLTFAGAFLPEGKKITSGHFSGLLNTEFNLAQKKLTVDGSADIDALMMKLGANNTGQMSIKNKFDIAILNYNSIELKKQDTSVYDKKAVVATISNSGNIDVKAKKVNVSTLISKVDQGIVRIFKPDFSTKFNVNGSVKISTDGDFAQPYVKADINADKISAPQVNEILNARLKLDVHSGKNQIVLDTADCTLNQKDKSVTNIKASGYLAFPVSSGKSRFTVDSEKLDLKLLETLIKSKSDTQTTSKKMAASKTRTKTKTKKVAAVKAKKQTEPKAVQLDADVEVKINMKNISYGSDVVCSVDNSKISIKQSKVTVDPCTLKINKTTGTLFASSDLGHSDGYPFAVKSDFDSLDLAPLLKAASSTKSRNIAGVVKDFKLNLSGKGFTDKNLEKNLNGYIKLKTSGMSIPNSLDDIPIINIIMLPIESFAEIAKYVPNISTSEVNQSISAAQNICNDINNLNLKSGSVNIDIKSGRADIKELQFAGNFIKQLGFTGYIPISPEANMKLVSTMDIYSIKFPLEIGGTYRNPKPDMEKMIPQFLSLNIDLQKIIDNPEEGLKDIVNKAKNILNTEILKGKSSDSEDSQDSKTKESQEKDDSKSEDKLEKKVNDLIDNLLDF